jgi:hypothetical protein
MAIPELHCPTYKVYSPPIFVIPFLYGRCLRTYEPPSVIIATVIRSILHEAAAWNKYRNYEALLLKIENLFIYDPIKKLSSNKPFYRTKHIPIITATPPYRFSQNSHLQATTRYETYVTSHHLIVSPASTRKIKTANKRARS